MVRRRITPSLLALTALLGFGVAITTVAPRAVQAQPTMVVLVRHGEKQAAPADDPSLSIAGVARAEALAGVLRDAPPRTIVVSARKRTAETAAVVAQQQGITPMVIALDGGTAAHVAAVAAAVQRATGVVLVVGHSNTVPAIIKALGGPALPDLCDASYATLFVLTPKSAASPAALVRSSYGVPDAPMAANCAGMTPK